MTATRYDTYGWRIISLEQTLPGVARALGVQLQRRDSGYYGGQYYKYRSGTGRQAMLFANFDPRRSEWVRPRFRGYSVLLQVADLPEMDAIRSRLGESFPAIELLESREIENDDEVPAGQPPRRVRRPRGP